MDERLSVGDRHFVEMAQQRLDGFIERGGGVVVLAPQNVSMLERVRTNGVLDAGRVKAPGPINAVLEGY